MNSQTNQKNRVVVLVDMDCFYVQVIQRKNPSLYGKPCAVCQYKTWRGGGYEHCFFLADPVFTELLPGLVVIETRGIFRILLNICDGTFLRK